MPPFSQLLKNTTASVQLTRIYIHKISIIKYRKLFFFEAMKQFRALLAIELFSLTNNPCINWLINAFFSFEFSLMP